MEEPEQAWEWKLVWEWGVVEEVAAAKEVFCVWWSPLAALWSS